LLSLSGPVNPNIFSSQSLVNNKFSGMDCESVRIQLHIVNKVKPITIQYPSEIGRSQISTLAMNALNANPPHMARRERINSAVAQNNGKVSSGKSY
jgi:hypothetical protein